MSAETERKFLGNGRYALDQLLGKGGAGEVFLAYDTSLNRWVAIKRIPATDPDLFQEATVLASFQHPNIVTVHDVLLEGGEMLLVMEFVQGQTLEELAEPMAEETFRDFAVQCLEGLGAAHEKNIVHRDIKPGNIMFAGLASGGYRAKLLDFGQSRLMQAPSLQTMDQGGAVVGSIYMMSPEQLNHEELDLRTDFYSLGCVFYQALTLQRPFTGDNVAQVLSAHLQHRFTPLSTLRPDLPKPLTAWVEHLFSLDRNDRPSDALEAMRALKSSLSPSGAVRIATTANKGIKVVAKPVLKAVPALDLEAATMRVALPLATPAPKVKSEDSALKLPIAAAQAHSTPSGSVSVSRSLKSSPVVVVAAAPISQPVPVIASTPVQVAPVAVAVPTPISQPVTVIASTPVQVAPVAVAVPAPISQPVPVIASTPIRVADVVDETPALIPEPIPDEAPPLVPDIEADAEEAFQPVAVALSPVVEPAPRIESTRVIASQPIVISNPAPTGGLATKSETKAGDLKKIPLSLPVADAPMKRDRKTSPPTDETPEKPIMNRPLPLIIAAAVLILIVGGWALWSKLSDSKPAPDKAATSAPVAAPAQKPPTDEDFAKSLAFPTTVISISDKSITFQFNDAPITLPIDQWTTLVGVKSIQDIKPKATIGIRLTGDQKRVLVLNGAGMK